MALQNTVITAPMAIVKVGGIAVGKLKGVTVDEDFRRIPVKGLGQLFADEMPLVDWAGAFTCDSYLIDFGKALIEGSIKRNVSTVEDLTAYLLLQQEGIVVELLKRVKTGNKPNGVPESELKAFATIKYCFANRDGFNIAEGQVGGRNMSFMYTEPILTGLN